MNGEYVYGGRKFEFAVPTPIRGCSIYNMLMTYRVPFAPVDYFGVATAKEVFPTARLEEFMNLCLQNVVESVDLESKVIKIPVMNDEGHVGISNPTGPMLATLTTQFLLFFGPRWLKDDLLNSSRSQQPT
jgi:hypothetical protein